MDIGADFTSAHPIGHVNPEVLAEQISEAMETTLDTLTSYCHWS